MGGAGGGAAAASGGWEARAEWCPTRREGREGKEEHKPPYANPGYQHRSWGRVVDIDGLHRAFMATGLKPESPRDAAWGERFFHVTDPDGHELSFAELFAGTSIEWEMLGLP